MMAYIKTVNIFEALGSLRWWKLHLVMIFNFLTLSMCYRFVFVSLFIFYEFIFITDHWYMVFLE